MSRRGRRSRRSGPVHIEPTGPVLHLRGEGLQNFLPEDEARRRLDALVTPVPIGDWAGPVADAATLEREHGVTRADVEDWERRQLIIGLDDPGRGRVYPTEQFAEGRPVAGVAEILAMVRKPRVAWHWLARPQPSMGNSRAIALLRSGQTRRVLASARREWLEQW